MGKNINTNVHTFRLGTINVRTCKCESKLADCVRHSKRLGHDVTCMQEVRQMGNGEICFKDDVLNGWRVIYNGMQTARAGVAVVLAPHGILLDIQHIIEGRLTVTKVKVKGIKLAIYSCYCPTEEHADSTKETFYQTLSKAIQKMKKDHSSYKVIAAGDFNATIGHDYDPSTWKCLGPYHINNKSSFNGMKLIETAESNALCILNTTFATRSSEHLWTFHSNLGYKRRLDYILAEWFVKTSTNNCRSYPKQSQPFESDHCLVVMDANFPTKKMVEDLHQ